MKKKFKFTEITLAPANVRIALTVNLTDEENMYIHDNFIGIKQRKITKNCYNDWCQEQMIQKVTNWNWNNHIWGIVWQKLMHDYSQWTRRTAEIFKISIINSISNSEEDEQEQVKNRQRIS